MSKELVYEKLEEQYDGEIPDYIMSAGKSYITVLVSDWQGKQRLKITVNDLVRYYAREAGNITSSMRSLAGHYGDWRMIDNLAREALAWFKVINRPLVEREARKYGMQLK